MAFNQPETYEHMCRRQVLQKAMRYAGYGLWKIKSPKKILRCDICQFGKRKQAVYASWYTTDLYCEEHATNIPVGST